MSDSAVHAHYDRPDLAALVLDGAASAGKDVDALTIDDLAPVDQFHARGRAATLDLARLAGAAAGMRVLDVGGGLGGPARTLAHAFGCQVTVLDLSQAYCDAGAELTRRTGLSARVAFEHGSALAMPFPDASFDLVWTQHSSMNIADKRRLYAEIGRVLRAGGRLAIHEIMAGPATPIHLPVPWARRPEISSLAEPAQVRAIVAGQGLRELSWSDETEITLQWYRARLAAATAGAAPFGLHLLLGDDYGAMFLNLVRNLAEQRIVVIQGVFGRP